MSATCGGCDVTWTGLGIAHCAACHETFTTVGNFDRHRVAAGRDERVCADPVDRGMVQNSRGQWHPPDADGDSRRSGITQGDEPPRVRTRTRAGRK